MGWTPEQTAGQGLWQIAAAIDGWNRAQGGDGAGSSPGGTGGGMTAERLREINPARTLH